MAFNWQNLIKVIALAALQSHPKTARIADEVAAAIPAAEAAFGSGTGRHKLEHVLSVAREAASAVDELRGSEDEAVGAVRAITDVVVRATNEIDRLVPFDDGDPSGEQP
jgi:hypothetical protein